MIYRINKINDVAGLSRAMAHCRGKIEIRTPEGDMLNLKSELARQLSLQAIVVSLMRTRNVSLFVEDEKDSEIILQYMLAERLKDVKPHLVEMHF